MGNTDRRGPDISDGWQGASDDGVDSGRQLKVAVVGAGVAGLGKTAQGIIDSFKIQPFYHGKTDPTLIPSNVSQKRV